MSDAPAFERGPIRLFLGDNRVCLKSIPDNSIDAVVTDAPYGLSGQPDMVEVLKHWLNGDDYEHGGGGFMGKAWDSFVPGPAIWKEVFRVLKPGGHVVSFFGTRTYDIGVLAIRLAGFEVRDQIAWCYGCLDEFTEAVTPDGIVPHHAIKTGDLVLCYDVESGGYSYQPVQEVVEYDYADTAYRLVGDFGEQVVSRNHRLIVERGGREVFVFAEEAAQEQQARVPVLESLSDLQNALCDNNQRAGDSQQDVRRGLQAGVDAHGGCASYQPRCDRQSAGEPDVVSHQRGTQTVRAWRGHKAAMVRIEPFQHVGKVWCLRVPTGAFVAVRGGVAFPTGNSGFPKSLNVSKAIDKAAGAEREVVGYSRGVTVNPEDNRHGGINRGAVGIRQVAVDVPVTAPATDAAKQWEGWGTALKPAQEPIVLARKPLLGSVAANVLEHGVGALNIDGCRVGMSCEDADFIRRTARPNTAGHVHEGQVMNRPSAPTVNVHTAGRWPANLIHDGSDEVVGVFPQQSGLFGARREGGDKSIFSGGGHQQAEKQRIVGGTKDTGSAARFFFAAPFEDEDFDRLLYVPKANRRDRDGGLDEFEERETGKWNGGGIGERRKAAGQERSRNHHPTVKPVALMRYLCRMVTPPGGTVLDPFMGSGSTGKAAMMEGFSFVGMEMSEDYFEIAKARILHAANAAVPPLVKPDGTVLKSNPHRMVPSTGGPKKDIMPGLLKLMRSKADDRE